MSETKPLASLSGALLARKGQAIPAMRRQNMMALNNAHQPNGEALEDLGWNDMGHEQPAVARNTGLSPMAPSPIVEVELAEATPVALAPVPVVVQQQRELAAEIEDVFSVSEAEETLTEQFDVVETVEEVASAPVPVHVSTVKTAPRSAPGSRGKAAFTLRLDSDRHLKLRLVCALQHKSAQQVVTAALDAFLAKQRIPESISPNSSSTVAVG